MFQSNLNKGCNIPLCLVSGKGNLFNIYLQYKQWLEWLNLITLGKLINLSQEPSAATSAINLRLFKLFPFSHHKEKPVAPISGRRQTWPCVNLPPCGQVQKAQTWPNFLNKCISINNKQTSIEEAGSGFERKSCLPGQSKIYAWWTQTEILTRP